MAWDRYREWGFPRYVSAAEKKSRAAQALVSLGKKRGRGPEPVVLQGKKIATTFWGKAWCENLEHYMDFANRLPRGRTYVRNRAVVDLAIQPGQVQARVAGSLLYTVKITIAPLDPARWQGVIGRCTGKIGSLVSLLRGELSDELLSALVHPRDGLFPEPKHIKMECSCPDWAGMCKHVAAVLYGVGARLDTKPELFFTLRQVDQNDLVAKATSGVTARTGTGGGKRIAADKLAGVFGIELDDAPAASASIPKPSRKKLPPGKHTVTPRKTTKKPAAGKPRGRR